MTPVDVVLLVVAGLVAGGVNAIAGGGTLIMFPALVATGMPTVSAAVTNAVALWPGYVGNVASLGPQARKESLACWPLAIYAVLGSLIGSALLLAAPPGTVDVVIPVLVLGASLVLAFQPKLRARLGGGADHDRPMVIALAVVGVGIYGGFFQGALGVILLAVLGIALSAPIAVTNAIKGMLQLVVVSTNVVVFSLFGPVDWAVAALVAPASLLGGVIGGRFARRADATVLRRCVVVFGIAVGLWLAVRALV
ncbi:MAG: hypothetical protein JWN61_2863 [Pseudonocardiales bacterium]|nr:hypothetical protein [Pseudonocardiales bacterium]